MEKLNFEEFEKRSEEIITEDILSKINGGASEDNLDSDIEDTDEGVKPHAKF